jgi:hypothetical protein
VPLFQKHDVWDDSHCEAVVKTFCRPKKNSKRMVGIYAKVKQIDRRSKTPRKISVDHICRLCGDRLVEKVSLTRMKYFYSGRLEF